MIAPYMLANRHGRARLRALGGGLALAFILASCGDGSGGSGAVSVTTAATATPSPTPSATPSPTATPTAVTTAGAGELYVLGTLTWHFEGTVPDTVSAKIKDSMDYAANTWNTLAAQSGDIKVLYDSSVPTADASYQWNIRYGNSISRRVAQHETAHWLGSGTYDTWRSKLSNGHFDGPLVNARIKAFDGASAVLNADTQHFWPYGLNYDNEFFEVQRNVQMVSAQRGDMGLTDTATAIAGDRRFTNRASSLLLDGAQGNGTAPRAGAYGSATSLTWTVTYADGYIVLANASNGLAIDSLGSTNSGAAAGLAAKSGSTAQQWDMIPTDTGWFQLRNRQTGKCLDNGGVQTAGAAIQTADCGTSNNQQWHLIR